jgi:hypothetical protein
VTIPADQARPGPPGASPLPRPARRIDDFPAVTVHRRFLGRLGASPLHRPARGSSAATNIIAHASPLPRPVTASPPHLRRVTASGSFLLAGNHAHSFLAAFF